MINYLLESTACWTIFYLLYTLWLRKETFFVTNRWYLIGALIAGLLIPIIPMPVQKPISDVYFAPINESIEQIEFTITAASVSPAFEWSDLFVYAYALGVFVFGVRFLRGNYKIWKLYRKSEHFEEKNYIVVYTDERHLPFSFFNCLFWSKQLDLSLSEQNQIWRHEEAHIKQGHSFDVLFLECMLVLFWCSPILYFYRKAIRVTHEYLADDAVLKTTHHLKYGQLLLKQSMPNLQIAFANNFFHSHLKQRILMMTRNKSAKQASWKYLPIIPLLALALLLFANKDVQANFSQLVDQIAITPNDTIPAYGGDILKVVDEMPRFTGCEEMSSDAARQACAQKALLKYIYTNIRYPKSARKAGVEGTVVVKFIVEKDGRVSNVELLRNIGGDCGKEVIRLVESMNEGEPLWTPGKQDGEEVRVEFVLPVKFKLQGSTPAQQKTATTHKAEKVEQVDSKTEEIEETANKLEQVVVVGYGNKPDQEIFKIVEEMPRFIGCEEVEEKEERRSCAQKEMFTFIYTNIKYPKAAKDAGIEGTSVVQFTVEKDGSVSDLKMVRSIGGGTDKAVLNMMRKMQEGEVKWIPGKQRGQNVRVRYTLPIKFKLEDNSADEKEIETTNTEIAQRGHAVLTLEQLAIRPNPVSDQLHVQFEAASVPTTIQLVSTDGKLMYNQVVAAFNGTYNEDINVENLTTGIYFLKVEQSGKIFTEQIVVE